MDIPTTAFAALHTLCRLNISH